MAANVYLKIYPTGQTTKFFKGNCQVADMKEWIEITEYGHTFTQKVSAASRSSELGPTSRCDHEPITMKKFVDNASDDLIQACWTGQCLDLEVAIFRTIGGSTTQLTAAANKAIIVYMKRAYLTKYTINPASEEGGTEDFDVVYNYIQYGFTPVNFSTGVLDTAKRSTIAWDWAGNTVSPTASPKWG
jgi:type VI secretion system Hcp family effector